MVSSTNAAYNLTVHNAASGGYALKLMTIVVVIFLPLVLLYQGWSFHVFRGRLKGPPAEEEPQATVASPAPQT
jgi:cytochrome d ubiquinol oxidase subunit II